MLKIVVQNRNQPYLSQFQCVPLKRVHIEATIRSFAADVTITQVFRNDKLIPIEVVYCFPIEEQAAVYAFTARIVDREIVAQLKEKQTSQRGYNTSLRQSRSGTSMLEQNEESQENFIINIGVLPPSKTCTITIAYVTELNLINRSTIRFTIPTTIVPRYNPRPGGFASSAGRNAKYFQSSTYTIAFRCRVEKISEAYVARLNSTSHPIQVDFTRSNVYVVSFTQQHTHLDRDILLDIELVSRRTNTIVTVESGAIMAAYLPSENENYYRILNNNEFIFIIDCSGSMRDENKIGLAREIMFICLKNLPVHCYFNVIRFGSKYEIPFAETTVINNEENIRHVEQYINRMQADLGGTELLTPVQWLAMHSPGKDRARQVFLLTDGEISNMTEVLDLCRSMATSTRIFSFGLGSSPSRALVKGLARTTNGRFVFIPSNANVDTYVKEQLQRALQPCLVNIQVRWNLGIPVLTSPIHSLPIYLNDRFITYALFDDKRIQFDQNSTVEFRTKSGHHSLGIAQIDRVSNMDNNGTIARLAAKALILELQNTKTNLTNFKQVRIQEPMTFIDKTTTKQRIIKLSLKYNLLSPYTTFVGIEKRTTGSNVNRVLREVPIQISTHDQPLSMTRPSIRSFSQTRTSLQTPSRYNRSRSLSIPPAEGSDENKTKKTSHLFSARF